MATEERGEIEIVIKALYTFRSWISLRSMIINDH